MPNGTILKRLLEKEIDDTIEPARVLDLFNAGLRDLSLVARKKTKTFIPFIRTERTKPLPVNLLETTEVRITLTSGLTATMVELANYYGLEIFGDPGNLEILWAKDLPQDGTFEIRGHRSLKEMTTLDETPELPEFAHNALVYFAAREYFNGDDEPEASNQRNILYLTKKAELDAFTKQTPNDPSPKIMDARPPWMRR